MKRQRHSNVHTIVSFMMLMDNLVIALCCRLPKKFINCIQHSKLADTWNNADTGINLLNCNLFLLLNADIIQNTKINEKMLYKISST